MNLESDLLFGWSGNRPLAAHNAPPEYLAALAEPLQQLIDDLPEQIALLDEDCAIFAANRAWKQAVEDYGYLEALPGHNYRDFCASKAAEGYEPAVEALAALDDIWAGRRTFWQLIYNGRENWHGRDYQISFHRIWFGGRSFISVTRFDLTEILELRRERENLTASLMEGQAIERQRMGRELHDSAAQLLTSIGLVLGRLRQRSPEPEILDPGRGSAGPAGRGPSRDPLDLLHRASSVADEAGTRSCREIAGGRIWTAHRAGNELRHSGTSRKNDRDGRNGGLPARPGSPVQRPSPCACNAGAPAALLPRIRHAFHRRGRWYRHFPRDPGRRGMRRRRTCKHAIAIEGSGRTTEHSRPFAGNCDHSDRASRFPSSS